MKRAFFLALTLMTLFGIVFPVSAANEPTAARAGFDEWGYNYQAHIFKGGYCDAYFNADWCQPWKDEYLIMKWNEAYLSSSDVDGDGQLDRHVGYDSYIGSGAWITYHRSGEYVQDGKTCQWSYFTKFVAVPADATLSAGVWYSADGRELGVEVWDEFAIVQNMINDPCAGVTGIEYHSQLPGLGGH